MHPSSILLLDPDPRPAPLLANRLGVRVVSCRTVKDAFAALETGNVGMVVGEAALERDFDGLEALSAIQAQGIPVVVWTARSVDELVAPARTLGLGVVTAKTTPLLLDELALCWKLRLKGWAPGLEKFLGTGAQVLGEDQASALVQVSSICRKVQASLETPLSTSRRLRLVLDELLSNAIHHSPEAAATIRWGRDSTKHVFAVQDPSGILEPDETMRLLDRHIRGEGLLDSRGRGLHLSRIYADRLYVNVVQSRATEVVAVFWNQTGAFQGFKPVWMLRTVLSKES
jgi:anti-sigma regulatory factor (Ser/Thr protein kinase)